MNMIFNGIGKVFGVATRCVLIGAMGAAVLYPSRPANACLTCTMAVSLVESPIWDDSREDFMQHVNDRFMDLEDFLIRTMWARILQRLMLSAEQFSAITIYQVMAIGMFFDAKEQMEAQQLLQVLQTKAMKDYHPSEGMCQFGSAMKSLAASDMRSEFTAFVLSQRSQDRQLGAVFSSSAFGNDLDKIYRILQFKKVYCNEKDRNASLDPTPASAIDNVCDTMEWDTITQKQRYGINRDIDYLTVVDQPLTLKLDFTNSKILDEASTPKIYNEDEQDVFAMSANIFGHELFARPPAKSLEYIPNKEMTRMQEAFLDMRSIIAKRSVAENSFSAIVGSKAQGSGATDFSGQPMVDGSGNPRPVRSKPYLVNIIRNLGLTQTEATQVLGDNPSYNAQMEVLTKKIFQSPDFYTNLYDKPANVKRKTVTMQAIRMMQKFDMLKSFLRGEASFSLLLEMAVVDLQREIESQIKTLDVSEKKVP